MEMEEEREAAASLGARGRRAVLMPMTPMPRGEAAPAGGAAGQTKAEVSAPAAVGSCAASAAGSSNPECSRGADDSTPLVPASGGVVEVKVVSLRGCPSAAGVGAGASLPPDEEGPTPAMTDSARGPHTLVLVRMGEGAAPPTGDGAATEARAAVAAAGRAGGATLGGRAAAEAGAPGPRGRAPGEMVEAPEARPLDVAALAPAPKAAAAAALAMADLGTARLISTSLSSSTWKVPSANTASTGSSVPANITKPKPRDLQVSRLYITCALSTAPYFSKYLRKLASSVP